MQWKTVADHPDYEICNQVEKLKEKHYVPIVRRKDNHFKMKATLDKKYYRYTFASNRRLKNGTFARKKDSAHRLYGKAWIPNPKGKPFIDHDNGDTTDNRPENLRWATRGENQRNNKHKAGSSGVRGVSKIQSGKYRAHIGFEGKLKHLGTFETIHEAEKARLKKELELYGDFMPKERHTRLLTMEVVEDVVDDVLDGLDL